MRLDSPCNLQPGVRVGPPTLESSRPAHCQPPLGAAQTGCQSPGRLYRMHFHPPDHLRAVTIDCSILDTEAQSWCPDCALVCVIEAGKHLSKVQEQNRLA